MEQKEPTELPSRQRARTSDLDASGAAARPRAPPDVVTMVCDVKQTSRNFNYSQFSSASQPTSPNQRSHSSGSSMPRRGDSGYDVTLAALISLTTHKSETFTKRQPRQEALPVSQLVGANYRIILTRKRHTMALRSDDILLGKAHDMSMLPIRMAITDLRMAGIRKMVEVEAKQHRTIEYV